MAKKNQLDELVDRATTPEEELLPLLMPEDEDVTAAGSHSQQSKAKAAPKDDPEDEELDNKSARRKLLESLTDDEGEKSDFSVSYVLRGDILTAQWLRKQIWWIIMVIILTFLYISNRYYAQKQQIHINKLKQELKEVHYDAMARSSELMRNYRRSTIMELLDANGGTTLQMPEKQPASFNIK